MDSAKRRSTGPLQPARSPISRRRFLAGASAALAAPWIVPASSLGRDGAVAPSEQITVGIIGLGDRGSTLIGGFLHQPQARVVAVCDTYRDKHAAACQRVDAGYATSGAGNGGCSGYTDFRDMLACDDVDAVAICSPENWHAIMMAQAVQAGKAVYGEKALTLTVAEGRAVCDMVHRYGAVFQVGLQQRSSANFRHACELARNGYLGDLKTIHVAVPGGRALPNAEPRPVPEGLDYEMWLGPAPWTPYNDLKCVFNWYFMSDYCAGWIQSWGVHHMDTALWGAPALRQGRVRVQGEATFPADGLADTSITWKVDYETESGLKMHFYDDGQYPHGCRFEGTEGWVMVHRGGIWAEPESLLRARLEPNEEHLYVSNDHLGNFLECIRSRRATVAPVEAGHWATTATLIGDIATRVGHEVVWDWSRERFQNDPVADRLLSRPLRSPWAL